MRNLTIIDGNIMNKTNWKLEAVPLVAAALVCMPSAASASPVPAPMNVEAADHGTTGVDCPWRENVAAWMAFDTQRHSGMYSRGRLINHISYSNGCRFIYHHDARSGNEAASVGDECARDFGPLPRGVYVADFMYKNWGHSDIRGWVWSLGSKRCHNGTWRTNFYLHSKGYPSQGWSRYDYFSLGCIKINQRDRSSLVSKWHNRTHKSTPVHLHVR